MPEVPPMAVYYGWVSDNVPLKYEEGAGNNPLTSQLNLTNTGFGDPGSTWRAAARLYSRPANSMAMDTPTWGQAWGYKYQRVGLGFLRF